MFNKKTWAEFTGQVFNTLPRDGNDKSTIWLVRKTLEENLEQMLDFSGVHICIDGPTGTGKTSLAKTVLQRKNIKHILVQITKSMSWNDFCFQIIKKPKGPNPSFFTTFELGIEKGLPTVKTKFGVKTRESKLSYEELRDKISKTLTENLICEVMSKKNVTLFIDDFEKASAEIVQRIADMCKLLTESYVSKYAKLMIVGTDDIYKRLVGSDLSLEERLEEISIGTISKKNDSWHFLRMGFNKLDIENPSADYKKKYIDKKKLLECVDGVYEAANGLPKSLNVLGREICMRARWDRKRVSAADVINVSREMPKRNLKKFRGKFPEIIKCAENNIVVSHILEYFYRKGIGQIHKWNDIVTSLEPRYSEEQIDNAIMELFDVRFLMRTGFHNDILYVINPTLAHTLGVVASNPDRYDAPRFLFNKSGQLTLPFLKKK